MTCQCGSQKIQGAPETINPRNISVLCSLFGLEGELCRLLDLVPSAIKKIASLDPNVGNADQVFGDILKKVVQKSISISQIGDIDLNSFCSIEPPPQPEDITYQDVFLFIADLVPILNRIFAFNDILTGNSTRILDKIVAQWLRQKWFENCECKNCNSPSPTEPTFIAPRLFDPCATGSRTSVQNSYGEIIQRPDGVIIYRAEAIAIDSYFGSNFRRRLGHIVCSREST